MFHKFTEEELRSYCKANLESFEIWSRRLIHEKMTEAYGENYIDKTFDDGNYLIKKEVREHVHVMMGKKNSRFTRAVDTLFLEHIIYFLCHDMFYKNLFKDALKYAYPEGRNEAREFLSRLIEPRNALAHSNPISVRQAERVVCYVNDFIDGIKKYEKERGFEKVWNVPRIIRVTDSFGNVFENPADTAFDKSIFRVKQALHCGDSYSVNIEVDPSFDETEYSIEWKKHGSLEAKNINERKLTIKFSEGDVGECYTFSCRVISNKAWHKYTFYDCEVMVALKVFPPNE